MNKSQLVAAVAESSGLSNAEADSAISAFAEVISKAMADREKVTLPGFAVFEARHREARQGRNPSTGEAMEIAAAWVVKVTPGSALKAAANA